MADHDSGGCSESQRTQEEQRRNRQSRCEQTCDTDKDAHAPHILGLAAFRVGFIAQPLVRNPWNQLSVISLQVSARGRNQDQKTTSPLIPCLRRVPFDATKRNQKSPLVFWPGNRLPKFGRRVARLARRLSEATWARSACEGNAARRDESVDEW